MASLRPSVNDNDGYIEKIVKYIPAEIVAGYTALVGYLGVDSGATEIPNHYKAYYATIIIALAILTPIWTYYAVYDKESQSFISPKKKALFHAVVSFFAFLVWVYAIGNIILKAILCKCDKLGCDNDFCCDCGAYNLAFGSIVLVLFTIATPLLERIILGTRISPT